MSKIFPDAYYDRVSEVLTVESNNYELMKKPEALLIRHLNLLSQFLNLKNGRILLRDPKSGDLSLRYCDVDESLPPHRHVGCDGVSEHDVSKTKLYVPVASNDTDVVTNISTVKKKTNKAVEAISVSITHHNMVLGALIVDSVYRSSEERLVIEKVLAQVAEMFSKIVVENSLCEVPLSA